MSTIAVTKESFTDLIRKPGIVLIDFWAGWCGPCRMFAPVFEAAAARHPDITWAKVDTEAEPELAGALDIRAIPTLMVFRDNVLLLAQPGVMSAKGLDELVAEVRSLDMVEIVKKARPVRPEEAAL
jgi:thioredoxin 1